MVKTSFVPTLRYPRSTLPSRRFPPRDRISSPPNRCFSASPCSRIILEDDDEEDEHFRQPPARQQHHVRRANIVFASPRNRPKTPPARRPLPRPIDPRQVQRFENEARRLHTWYLQLAGEYVTLRYAYLEDHIGHCSRINIEFRDQYAEIIQATVTQLEARVLQGAVTNAHLEHRYCEIAFRASAWLRSKVSSSDLDISRLRANIFQTTRRILDQAVEDSASRISAVQTLLDREYLRPRASARAKIDGLLGYAERMHEQYKALRAKSRVVLLNISDIRQESQFLSHIPGSGRWYYCEFYPALVSHIKSFAYTSHWHRIFWLTTKQRSNPLKAAQLWSPAEFSPTMQKLSIAKASPRWILEAVMLPSMGPRRLRIQSQHLQLAERLDRIYKRKWPTKHKAPSGPTLNPYWRQLDIFAPLELFLLHNWWLAHELVLLHRSLSGDLGPLWSNLSLEEKLHHKSIFWEYSVRFLEDRKALLEELSLYKQINWVRLTIEQKLHRLGEYNDIQARGLFVPPSPLSLDHSRFQRWTKEMARVSGEAWIAKKVAAFVCEQSLLPLLERLNQEHEAEVRRYLRIDERRSALASLGTLISPSGKRTPTQSKIKSRHGKHARPGKQQRTRFRKIDTRATTSGSAVRISKYLRRNRVSQAKSNPPQEHPLPSPSIDSGPSGSERTQFRPMPSWGSRQFLKNRNPTGHSHAKGNLNRDSKFGVASQASQPSNRKTSDSHAQKSSKRELSSGRAFAHGSSQVCGDEILQRESQARGAPPIETTSNGPEQLGGDESLPDQSKSTENESSSTESTAPLFWSHRSQRGPDGQKIVVHYCRSLQSTEAIAQLFLGSKVIGFDMEWKAQVFATESIQNNLSLIQIANEERIALFHIALFKPARYLSDFISPSLKQILESPDITKVGVAIKADSTRLRKYLGIEARSIFELSHLYKLVKHGQTDPKLVNKRSVNLSDQIEEHLGLPLEKSDGVRCGDWTRQLKYRQVQCESITPNSSLSFFFPELYSNKVHQQMPLRTLMPASACSTSWSRNV